MTGWTAVLTGLALTAATFAALVAFTRKRP